MTTVILRSNIGFLGILDSRIQNLPVATWHLCSVDLRISCFVGIQVIVIILALTVVGCFFYSTDLWKYQGFSDVWVRLGSVRTGTVSNKEDLIFSGIQMPRGMKQQDTSQNRGRTGWKSYSGGADRLPGRTVYVLTAAQTTGKPGTKCPFCQSIKNRWPSHLSLSAKPHYPLPSCLHLHCTWLSPSSPTLYPLGCLYTPQSFQTFFHFDPLGILAWLPDHPSYN